MSLLKLYVPRYLSFISTQFLVANFDDWFVVSSKKFIILWYSIIILYYHINLRSSIIFCLSFGEIYLSLSVPFSFVFNFILFFIRFPIKSPVASAIFWFALFEAVLYASVPDCLAWSRNFWLCLWLKFLLIF